MELPEGSLYPRGFLPMWTEARDAEQAVYGLSYILQQIQATNTYNPNIGQINAAMSSLEFAIRALSTEVQPVGLEGREDIPALADSAGAVLRTGADETQKKSDIYALLASAWFYGGWVAETHTERQMQEIMEREGWWPIPSESALHQALDGGPRPARVGLTPFVCPRCGTDCRPNGDRHLGTCAGPPTPSQAPPHRMQG